MQDDTVFSGRNFCSTKFFPDAIPEIPTSVNTTLSRYQKLMMFENCMQVLQKKIVILKYYFAAQQSLEDDSV